MNNVATLVGRLVVLVVLSHALSFQAAGSPVIWIEGEDAVSIPDGLPGKFTHKLPASGGKSLIGKAFGAKGNKVVFAVTVPAAVPDAHLTMRYSRLQVMNWTEAEITVTVRGKDLKIIREEVIDQSGGWGAQSGKEWSSHAIGLGDLMAGEIEIEFSARKDNSDLNLDGFFLTSGPLSLKSDDFAECRSVQMSHDGGVGLIVRNTAIDQNQFEGMEIIGRGFGDEIVLLTAVLLDESGELHTLVFENKRLALSSEIQTVEISSADLADLSDGAYTIQVLWEEGTQSVSSSLVVMGDLMSLAAAKADEYESFAGGVDMLGSQTASRVKGDLQYAFEYIRHSLVMLKSREGQFDADDSFYKRALAYFEYAVQRTAVSFRNDLNGIVRQTDETIRRLGQGVDPYHGRSGDLRRAFFSDFSGQLEPYRILVPESYWEASKYKFLLALHGAGGDENYFPENGNGSFAQATADLGYLVAAPRANLRYRNGGEKDLKQLVELMQVEYSAINPDWLFCTGVSMGGGGTYRMAHTYPGLFRAVAIVSSGLRGEPDSSQIAKMRGTPVLILHGKLDGVLPVENAYRLADELKKRGFTHEIEVYPTYGHPYYGAEYLLRTDTFFRKYQ